MFLTTVSALALATAAPALLAAEADGAPTVVEEVVVTAQSLPGDPLAARRARAEAQKTPGAVAVVARETYEDHLATHLGEALHAVPGVYAQRRWGEDVRLSIRGSGVGNASHNRGVILVQDGIPFNQADGFGDFQEIDLLSARYIEVYKGGNALRFGGATMGGAIELNTPTGRNAPDRNQLRLEGGSFETRRVHGEAARRRGDWDAWTGITLLSADGWRDHSAQSSQRLSISAGHELGGAGEIRLVLSVADISNDIPGALTLDQALMDPTQAAPGVVARDYRRDMTSVRGALELSFQWADDWRFEGGLYAASKSLDHPISIVIDQASLNLGAFGRAAWEGRIGGRNADLLVGAWLRSGGLDQQTFVNAAGARGPRLGDGRQEALALDVFAEGRLFVTDRLAIVGGATAGRATRDYADRLNPLRSDDAEFAWIAPRLGLLWEAEGGQQVFANVTRSVEPPNFSALVQTPVPAFVPVRMQEAWTYELGARGRAGRLAWDWAAYHMTVENELLTFVPGPDIPAATFNAGPTLHSGVEAGLNMTLGEGDFGKLELNQTYAWSNFRFDGDGRYGSNQLPVVPEHHYHAELRFSRAGVFSVAPSLEWAPGDTWADYANTMKSPGYLVWSLNGSLEIGGHVTVFLDARNLTNQVYVSNANAITDARVASNAVFWPGEGRSAFVGLRARF
ncbi:TonB-dependent receptor [Brevundimonas sp. 2R-24]|uniref:TonB-dependent receptor n=1 Tax=Peiella sedimenti TaxID=3061083 RepID=A0ABT8SN28_9CAUL|nr:TonB-dependent receptor [Caulobacteraceae bacterium XZ-24]